MGRIETAFLYHTAASHFNPAPGRRAGRVDAAVTRARAPAWSTSTTVIRSARPRCSSALRAAGARSAAASRPTTSTRSDQDHYGGLAAVEALARRAGIGPGMPVLDVCAGLGGPARFLAARFGARVTGVDLTTRAAPRARAAEPRSSASRRAVRHRARRRAGPALPRRAPSTPPSARRACCTSRTRRRCWRECARVLAPGGAPRLQRLDRDAPARRRRAAPARRVDGGGDAPEHRRLSRAPRRGPASRAVEAEDLSAEWIGILRERLRMYRGLRDDTVARLGRGALRRVRSALRVLRGAGGGGQAGRRALQRKSRSRIFLTLALLDADAGGHDRSVPGAPVTPPSPGCPPG